MNITGAEVVAFVLATITAFVAAIRDDWFPKVQKLALAVAFASFGFFLMVAEAFKISK
jgi:hypothetical protein